MTERPDAARHRWTDRTEAGADHDPTGVRTILSSLPDPAPMPEALVHRITASLAREEALREEAQHLGTVHSLAAAHGPEGSLRRRRPLVHRLPAIAVAASIVVFAGAVVLGVLTMNGGLVGGGADSSAGAMLSSDGREQAGDASVMAESAEGGADGPAAPHEDSGGTGELDGPVVLTTGTALTAATLERHARDILAGSLLTPDEHAPQLLSASALNTPSGVADCLAGLLAQPAADLETRVDAIDVVEFGGTTAVLALLTDAPAGASDPGGPVTAYLVPLTCRAEDAAMLHDPVRVG